MARSPNSRRVITVVCHYCGYTTHSMLDGMRHDAARPGSCTSWLERMEMALLPIPADQVSDILQALTVYGDGNLNRALDDFYEKIQALYASGHLLGTR